jgi:Zn-dependent protease with chaperone function
MAESIAIDRQLVSLLAYLLEESDQATFSEILKDRFDVGIILNDRENLLASIEAKEISANQKILLGFLAHLYAAFHSRNLFQDAKLLKVRQRLSLSDEFATYSFNCMGRIDPNHILKGRSALECLLNPDDDIARWILEIAYNSSTQGMHIEKVKMFGLTPMEYEHPIDKIALNALEKTPGLDTVIKKIMDLGVEYYLKLKHIGSNIRVTPHNFPYIHRALITACNNLNMPTAPELYVETGFINACTVGADNPIIVLQSGSVACLDYDELLFVIGHEVGHIKSKHCLYHTMGQVIPMAGEIIGSVTLGIGEWISAGLQLTLMAWVRKSELTADRAGLLACQNPDAAITAMMKWAGTPIKFYKALNKEEFLKQAKEFQDLDIDNLNKIAKAILIMDQTHPWTVLRASELQKWIDSGDYQKIVDKRKQSLAERESVEETHGAMKKFCAKCGTAFKDDSRFCACCGEKR